MLDALQKIGTRERRLAVLGLGLVITAIAVSAALLPRVKAYSAAVKAVSVLEDANANTVDLANVQSLVFAFGPSWGSAVSIAPPRFQCLKGSI